MTAPRKRHARTSLLSEADVARIRRLIAEGAQDRHLALQYQVSLWTIRAIKRGDTWGWVEPEAPDNENP